MNKLQKAKVRLAKQEAKLADKFLGYFGKRQFKEDWYKYYALQKSIVDKMGLEDIKETIQILRRV